MRQVDPLILASLIAFACAPSPRRVSGELDLDALGREEADLMATRADAETTMASVGPDGRFEITLDAGFSYALGFQTATRGRLIHFASLVYDSSRGKTAIVRIVEGGPVDLGRVRPTPGVGTTIRGQRAAGEGDSSGAEVEDSSGPSDGVDSSGPSDEGNSSGSSQEEDASGPSEDGGSAEASDRGGPGAGGERTDCRGFEPPLSNPDPASASGSDASTDIAAPADTVALHSSFLVVGEIDLLAENEEDADVHVGDALEDTDGDLRPDVADDDDDGDGVCDEEDRGGDDVCEEEGRVSGACEEDDDGSAEDERESDLPYDVRLSIGQTFRLHDAFAEKGPLPLEIMSVEMDGGAWRLGELEANSPFVVTQEDCDHMGNRDRGRDRVFVAWKNTNGSLGLDHLDLRYCDR